MRVEASHGSLELCHDELGRSYRTPIYCFVDPLNLIRPVTKSFVQRTLLSKKSSLSSFFSQHINLKVRINPGKFDIDIVAAKSDTILDLKHHILEQSSKEVSWKKHMHHRALPPSTLVNKLDLTHYFKLYFLSYLLQILLNLSTYLYRFVEHDICYPNMRGNSPENYLHGSRT